ncbi:MAG TPA: DUF6760 family protein [Blastocatellia bacterium]|nr:DUF6760 family protein [Blastocatellia bacterium]
MPALRAAIRNGDEQPGGVWRYPIERLYEEVAYIAYHLHWPHDQILEMEHLERQKWVAEIARINRRLNDQAKEM